MRAILLTLKAINCYTGTDWLTPLCGLFLQQLVVSVFSPVAQEISHLCGTQEVSNTMANIVTHLHYTITTNHITFSRHACVN